MHRFLLLRKQDFSKTSGHDTRGALETLAALDPTISCAENDMLTRGIITRLESRRIDMALYVVGELLGSEVSKTRRYMNMIPFAALTLLTLLVLRGLSVAVVPQDVPRGNPVPASPNPVVPR